MAEPVIGRADRRAISRAFRLRWTLATTFGLAGGFALGILATYSAEYVTQFRFTFSGSLAVAFIGIAFAVPLGFSQELVLWRHLRRRGVWTLMSMLGQAGGFLVFMGIVVVGMRAAPERIYAIITMFPGFGYRPDTMTNFNLANYLGTGIFWAIMGALVGTGLGIAQRSILLRSGIPRHAWIRANAASMAIAFVVGAGLRGFIHDVWGIAGNLHGYPKNDIGVIAAIVIGVLVIGLMYGALTAYALHRLLRSRAGEPLLAEDS